MLYNNAGEETFFKKKAFFPLFLCRFFEKKLRKKLSGGKFLVNIVRSTVESAMFAPHQRNKSFRPPFSKGGEG